LLSGAKLRHASADREYLKRERQAAEVALAVSQKKFAKLEAANQELQIASRLGLETLTARVAMLEARNSLLEKQLAQAKDKKSGGAPVSVSASASAGPTPAQEGKEDLSVLHSQLLEADELNDQLKREKENLLKEIQAIKQAKSEGEKVFHTEKTDLLAQVRELKTELDSTTDRLSKELEALKAKLHAARLDIGRASAEREAERSAREEIFKVSEDQTSALKELQRQLTAAQQERAALGRKADADAERIRALEAQNAALVSQAAQLQTVAVAPSAVPVPAYASAAVGSDVGEDASQIAELKAEISKLKDTNKNRQTSFRAELDKRERALELKEAENLGAQQVLKTQNLAQRAQLAGAMAEVQRLTGENQRLISELSRVSGVAQHNYQWAASLGAERADLLGRLSSALDALAITELERDAIDEVLGELDTSWKAVRQAVIDNHAASVSSGPAPVSDSSSASALHAGFSGVSVSTATLFASAANVADSGAVGPVFSEVSASALVIAPDLTGIPKPPESGIERTDSTGSTRSPVRGSRTFEVDTEQMMPS